MRRVTIFIVVGLLAGACSDDDAADPERFCAIQVEFDQLGDPFELPPDEARELVREAEILIDESVEVAPDEIRASAEIVADSFTRIVDVLEAADFDAPQIDQADLDAAFEAAFSGEAGVASDAVDEWVDANCST